MEKEIRHSFQQSKFGNSVNMPKNQFGHTKTSDNEEKNILSSDKIKNKLDGAGNFTVETELSLDSVINNMERIMGSDRLADQMANHSLDVEEDEENEYVAEEPKQKFSEVAYTSYEEDDDLDSNSDEAEVIDMTSDFENHAPQTAKNNNDNYSELRNAGYERRIRPFKTEPAKNSYVKMPNDTLKTEENGILCTNPNCQQILPKNARFCLHCGEAQMQVLGRHCTGCGHKFNGKEKFCPECGNAR